MDTATLREREREREGGGEKRETFISTKINLILSREAQPATADVISPIGTSGRKGPCPVCVLDISVKVHANDENKRNHTIFVS